MLDTKYLTPEERTTLFDLITKATLRQADQEAIQEVTDRIDEVVYDSMNLIRLEDLAAIIDDWHDALHDDWFLEQMRIKQMRRRRELEED